MQFVGKFCRRKSNYIYSLQKIALVKSIFTVFLGAEKGKMETFSLFYFVIDSLVIAYIII